MRRNYHWTCSTHTGLFYSTPNFCCALFCLRKQRKRPTLNINSVHDRERGAEIEAKTRRGLHNTLTLSKPLLPSLFRVLRAHATLPFCCLLGAACTNIVCMALTVMDVVDWQPEKTVEPPRRADTPCPAALLQQQPATVGEAQCYRRGGNGSRSLGNSISGSAAFVLLPDGGFANRRYIELGAGTTVVSWWG